MKQLNAHDFPEIYKELKIDIDDLGCIMLDVEGSKIKKLDGMDEYLYTTKSEKKFWIKGFVAGKTPHVTLLYGLMKPGKEWKDYVDTVLRSWDIDKVKISEVSYFDSPYKYEEDPYYCIVAHLEISPELLEGNRRLQLLPHINTFVAPYKAHITIAYIKKDEEIRDKVIDAYNKMLAEQELKVIGINYGGREE